MQANRLLRVLNQERSSEHLSLRARASAAARASQYIERKNFQSQDSPRQLLFAPFIIDCVCLHIVIGECSVAPFFSQSGG